MARKERNNIDYFPHPVSHGKKMFYLRSKYKNDGYSVWFMLLEELGKAEYHYLDLSNNIQLMYLSSSFMVEEIVLKDIIKILVEFDEFDRDLWYNNSILFNNKFIENIQDAYKKRNNECININSLRILLTSKGILLPQKSSPNQTKLLSKGVSNPQSILEDSIVKKNKVNIIPEFSEFLNYALEKKPKVNQLDLRFKYDSWIANDWKNGNDKKIVNWKSNLLNTLPYIKEDNVNSQMVY